MTHKGVSELSLLQEMGCRIFRAKPLAKSTAVFAKYGQTVVVP